MIANDLTLLTGDVIRLLKAIYIIPGFSVWLLISIGLTVLIASSILYYFLSRI